MSDFITAIGLVLVLEGLAYGVAPAAFKRMAASLQTVPDETLRLFGLAALAAGTALVWLVRSGIGS